MSRLERIARAKSPRRMGETRAGDVQLDATASRADPRRRAPSDLKLPAGEVQQLEQERFSFGMGDEFVAMPRMLATDASYDLSKA